MVITRTYRFSITVTVDPAEDGYGDPEWIADAAWGSLSNEYGLRCLYGDIVDITESDPSPS